MKTIKLILLGIVLTLFSFTAVTTAISWEKTEIALGEVKHNEPVKIEFAFKNTGVAPILITNVQAGCGCTSVDYLKVPVKPGETSKVSATFNAAAMGAFKKTITVNSNAEETPRVLTFSGTVIEAASEKPNATIN